MSQSNQGGGSFVPIDTDNDEISQVPSTSSTDTRITRSGRATPTGLPPGTFARGEMKRTASQQSAVEAQNAVQAMVRRLERIDRVLSLYDQTLTTSQDADHLALNAPYHEATRHPTSQNKKRAQSRSQDRRPTAT